MALVNSDLFGKKGRKRSERENKDQVNLHDDVFLLVHVLLNVQFYID